MNTTTKSNIAGAVTMVPALILSQKIVKEVGWKKSIFPSHYLPVMKQHKVLSAIYYAGFAVQTVYTVKMVVDAVREAKAEQYKADQLTEALRLSTEELTREMDELDAEMEAVAAADKMDKYKEHLRLALENTTKVEENDQPLSRISPMWYEDRGCSDPEQQITPKATTQRIEVPVAIAELHAALQEQVRQAYDEVKAKRDAGAEYDAAQGYLADIKGTLWVSETAEVEVSQINSAIRMLNEMKANKDNVVSEWGVKKAEEILFDLSGFAIKDLQI